MPRDGAPREDELGDLGPLTSPLGGSVFSAKIRMVTVIPVFCHSSLHDKLLSLRPQRLILTGSTRESAIWAGPSGDSSSVFREAWDPLG